MSGFVLKAYAKINWGLRVISTRQDGYHELDSVMQRITLHDTLECSPGDTLNLAVEGAAGIPEDMSNLALRAAHVLRESVGIHKGANIRLEKRIPSQAGLGGGSADAAAALLGCNALWELGLTQRQLEPIAARVGSDVPACLYNCVTRVRGRGEWVSPLVPAIIHENAAVYHLVLVKPAGGLSTAYVFREYDRRPDATKTDMDALEQALLRHDLFEIPRLAHNHLQETAERLLPDIAVACKTLTAAGALFSRMTGSGSAVFGVFANREKADAAREMLRPSFSFCECAETLI